MATGVINRWDAPPIAGGFALRPANYILSKSLAAGVAESFTIPTSPTARLVLFSATADFYADYTTTAVVPGDVTNGTAPELNPAARYVPSDCTAISVISPVAAVITASFWTD